VTIPGTSASGALPSASSSALLPNRAVAQRPPTAMAVTHQLVERAIAWHRRRVACAAALVDTANEQAGGFGTPQASRAEELEQGEVAFALAGAAVGHP
jgi:hypothetical protein